MIMAEGFVGWGLLECTMMIDFSVVKMWHLIYTHIDFIKLINEHAVIIFPLIHINSSNPQFICSKSVILRPILHFVLVASH